MAILKHNNNSISNVTSFAQIPSGDPVLLSTATASSSASIEFNSTYINSDYKLYKFEFTDLHADTNGATFAFETSTNNGSSYGITKTSTVFISFHNEADTTTFLSYDDGLDLAQSTARQRFFYSFSSDADHSYSGNLHLFNPSSTTYVKHFIARTASVWISDGMADIFTAGYMNTTSAINAIKFSISSGTFSGTIKLYGIGAN